MGCLEMCIILKGALTEQRLKNTRIDGRGRREEPQGTQASFKHRNCMKCEYRSGDFALWWSRDSTKESWDMKV